MSEDEDFFKKHFQVILVNSGLTAAERREARREEAAERYIPSKEWAEAEEPPSGWEP